MYHSLTHYSTMLLIYILEKYQKTFRFSDFFKRYRKATPSCNELSKLCSYTRFFYKQHFYKQHQVEIGKKSRKSLATPWGWTFAIWKLFAFFSSIRYILQKCAKTKRVRLNEIVWLIIMKMIYSKNTDELPDECRRI